MERQNKKKEKNLFYTLMLGIISICVISMLVMLAYILLHSETVYIRTLSREMERFVLRSHSILDTRMEEYKAALEELSEDEALKDMIRTQGVVATPEIYNVLYAYRTRWDRNATLHLLPPDRTYVVSLGYNTHDYVIGNYAGIDQMLINEDGGTVVPKHFINTNGEDVVLVIANCITEGDQLLGYVYLDLSVNSIKQWFESDRELNQIGLTPYTGQILATWYDYLIYQNSPLQSVFAGNYLLDSHFTEAFRQREPLSRRYTEQGIDYLVTGFSAEDEDYVTIGVVRLDYLLQENRKNVKPVVCLCLFISVVGLIIAWKIHKEILVPIGIILDTLQAIDRGDRNARCRFQTNNEVTQIGVQLNQMIADVDQAVRDDAEKQELLRRAENNMLKAQIKPHFLNNVLESIYWMIRMGKTDQACTALTSLGKITTARMNFNTDFFETVSESMKITQYYITLQQLCYPDKFDVVIDIPPEDESMRIPVFILQPLVENAFVHGLQPKRGHGVVHLSSSRDDQYFYIRVEDDGVGMKPEDVRRVFEPSRDGRGIALENIYRRLQLHYGNEGRMDIRSEPDQGTIVTIGIPLKGERPYVLIDHSRRQYTDAPGNRL